MSSVPTPTDMRLVRDRVITYGGGGGYKMKKNRGSESF